MKCALVTGGASGIGAEFCRQLRESGWRVLVVDRTPRPDDPDSLAVDLTDGDSTGRVMAWLDAVGVIPDLWINNAGIFDFRKVEDLDERRVELYVDLHVRSLTLLTRRAALMMASRGSGHILNMSSMSCWMPMPGIAMYSATKAYIRVFSRALHTEMKPRGVTVTVACPGGIATDLFGLPRNLQRLGVRVGALATPQKFVRKALKRTLRGRRQYINGWLNHMAIPAVSVLPECLRRMILRWL